MKIKYTLLPIILVMFFALTMFGQSAEREIKKNILKKDDISGMLGKPVFELTVDSLNTKVWIISLQKYKGMMKTRKGKTMGKMKDDKMPMDKGTKETMTSGTHYFIFDVTNITTGMEFADTSAKVAIVSPTKKMASVSLRPMMNHFGGGITLDEKGYYLFTINLNVGSGYKTTQFKYKLK
jgi:hypothetical protein